MALVETTLGAACSASANSIVVSSATSMAAGVRILIDGEVMYSTRAYETASTTVPVLRAQEGTEGVAHPVTAAVEFGAKDDSGWGSQGAQSVAQFLQAGRPQDIRSYSATGAIDLPDPGTDRFAILNAVSTTILAMTVAVPTKAMDGCRLTIASRNGTGAHTVTVASGFNGQGSSYDVFTFPAGPVMIELVALDSLWYTTTHPAWTGTVTLLVGGIA